MNQTVGAWPTSGKTKGKPQERLGRVINFRQRGFDLRGDNVSIPRVGTRLWKTRNGPGVRNEPEMEGAGCRGRRPGWLVTDPSIKPATGGEVEMAWKGATDATPS